jgi:hypothetical protein
MDLVVRWYTSWRFWGRESDSTQGLILGIENYSGVRIIRFNSRDINARPSTWSYAISIKFTFRPDRFWGAPSRLYNGYQGLFLGGKAAGE